MYDVDVTIIVCTYNSDTNKLLATLDSIVLQKGVKKEILICDDGSKKNNKKEIDDYIVTHKDYVIDTIFNEKNQGIVKNIYGGVQKANGKYIYTISPGDLLYNDHVLCDLYDFATKNSAQYCSGYTVAYSVNEDGSINYQGTFPMPSAPEVYMSKTINMEVQKISIICGNSPGGPACLRSKNTMMKYLGMIIDKVIYVEDLSLHLLSVLDNNPIYFYDIPVVWYETGTGISSGNSTEWDKKIQADVDNIYKVAIDKFPNDSFLQFKIMYDSKQKLKSILTYPYVYYLRKKVKYKIKHNKISYGIKEADKEFLYRLLKKYNICQ